MGIALTLQQYLDDRHIDYDVLLHKRTHCSQDTAHASHVIDESPRCGSISENAPTATSGHNANATPATQSLR